MASVSLDGIRIEVPHRKAAEAIGDAVRRFADDIAFNRFSEWGVQIQEREGGRLELQGRRDRTHFTAQVEPGDGRVIVTVGGAIEINALKLGLAGGSSGVRRRVQDSLERALHQHLGG